MDCCSHQAPINLYISDSIDFVSLFDAEWSPTRLLAPLFFTLQFSIDISFYKFEAAFVEFLQKGQHCAQDVLVSVVVILCWQLASVLEACGAAWLSVVWCIVGLVKRRQGTTFRNQLAIIICGNRLILGTAITIWALKTNGCTHLVWTVVVSHVARRCLRGLVLWYLELLGLLLMAVEWAWILCLTVTRMHSPIIQRSWPLLKSN